ncbi:hypothetical protein PENSUB_7485 [Penicillium subrubescens]|uniref:Uncharacterized protein n=1 Tax=Penicillium subrubescens TaxID=1316194 RepID=A0A1Q5TKZ7_9EURO|nr:hypothetical protein PENSUB_7485 [Penicillium subrubescens]
MPDAGRARIGWRARSIRLLVAARAPEKQAPLDEVAGLHAGQREVAQIEETGCLYEGEYEEEESEAVELMGQTSLVGVARALLPEARHMQQVRSQLLRPPQTLPVRHSHNLTNRPN